MKLKWDENGKRLFETGVDHAVLYPISNAGNYDRGVSWNGVTAVNESPSGAETTKLYADNIKYLNLVSAEDFGYTIEAYTYPSEWRECDGSAEVIPGVIIGQQSRKIFGLSYRSKIGNDNDGQDHGYKLHLIYGGLAAPSSRNYQTVNDSPSAITFSWTVSTTPVDVPGREPTACLTIDSTEVNPDVLAILEDVLYGTDTTEARLPLPEEVIAILSGASAVAVSVAAEDPATSLLGKLASELQTNVVVGTDSITGTLKKVTGYTGFSSKVSEQDGNYLALKMETVPADAVTTVELVGGTKGPVTLDADMNIVIRVTNKDTQSVKVVSTSGSNTTTKTFSLSGLILEA